MTTPTPPASKGTYIAAASQFGAERAPEHVLVALRAIDEQADVVHLGGSQWLLGVRKPNPAAQEKLGKAFQLLRRAVAPGGLDDFERAVMQSEIAKELRILQLCADGFRPIQLYDRASKAWSDWGAIIEDFRLRDYNWRVRPEAAFAELKEEVSVDAGNRRRAGVVREFFEQEGASLFRFVMKKARSFLQPGRRPATS